MTDEKLEQNGAEKIPHDTQQDSKRSLVGKIARLPDDIREQLNRRIRDGEAASMILAWLNELPEVKRILAEQFGGAPIKKQNLSKWRRGGYERWLQRQEPFAKVTALALDAGVFSRAGGNQLARGTASAVSARLFKMVQELPENCTAEELTKIAYAVTALVNVEQNNVRLENEKTGMHLRNELVTLQWDKHQRDTIAILLHGLEDEQCKAVQRLPIDNAAKIEMLGYRIYNDRWVPREVAGGEEKGKETENKLVK